jgi:hypothetical protein
LGSLTRPAQVCDVDQTVYAACSMKNTVRGDVLDCSFEYLSFFDLAMILYSVVQFGFDKALWETTTF